MVVNTEPSTMPASTKGAAAPSDALWATVSKSASLATKPRNGGSAAMLAVAPTAMISRGLLRAPSQASLRMSRVPVAWSMTPTTMNSAALNIACAHSIASPASIMSPPPAPTITVISPSWLTVPNARISLRSYSRTARQPASSIVSTPERDDRRPPRRGVGEPGRHPGDEVDTGLHHRRGVQVGADRVSVRPSRRAARSASARSPTCDSAPTRTSTTATDAARPVGGAAINSDSR